MLVAPLVAADADQATLPRYKFAPGRRIMIDFAIKSTPKDQPESTSTGQFEITQLRVNADGSARVIVRYIPGAQNAKQTYPDSPKLYYADVFPDGRIVPNDLLDVDSNIASNLPRLPADAKEMSSGWIGEVPDRQENMRYRATSSTPNEFVFTADVGGPLHMIYRYIQKRSYHFDYARGVIASYQISFGPENGERTDGVITNKLKSDDTIPAHEAAALAADLEVFIKTKLDYRNRMDELENGNIEAGIEKKALDLLTNARTRVKSPGIALQLDTMTKDHDDYAKDARETGEANAKILGKPSIDWQTTEIDGKPVKVSDFRGKVLVMDFWYRGCGFCMYAMPQVKQLADDYKGKPVAVVSMNTDSDVADARFVVDLFGLKHPTIKATGIDDKYGIDGFPTMLILDQAGVVRHVHVGYSPKLREKIGAKIDELLAEKPATPRAGG